MRRRRRVKTGMLWDWEIGVGLEGTGGLLNYAHGLLSYMSTAWISYSGRGDCRGLGEGDPR